MSYAVVEFESYGTIEVVSNDWIIRNGAGVVHVLWPNSCSSVNITALVKNMQNQTTQLGSHILLAS